MAYFRNLGPIDTRIKLLSDAKMSISAQH